MKKYKTPLIVIVIVIVLGALLVLPRLLDPNRELIAGWKKADVVCLINGHTNLVQHFHPVLSIVVDAEPEAIPANIGIVPTCMAETHTHDEGGAIHTESFKGEKEFKLSQFFTVWGKPIEREGYDLNATLDGEELTNPGELILKDGQKINLEYAASVPQPEPVSE